MSKLEELILYILAKAGPREPIWVSTAIYLADLESYLKTGKTISGTPHIRERWGPAPKDFGKVLARMIARRDVAVG